MFEQIHFNSSHDKFSDYELIVYAEMQPNEIGYLKIEKSEQPSQALLQKKSSQDTKLEIEGYNAKGEVMFRYKNKAQNISQSFALSLKYYKPHLEKHFAAADGSDLKDKLTDENLKVMTQVSEGAYTFKPEFEDGHNQYTYSYSQLDPNVNFQGGKYMD